MRLRLARWSGPLFLLAGVLLLFAAAPAPLPAARASAEAQPAPAQQAPLPQRTRISYGLPPGVGFAAYVGLERGYFAELNIDLELENLNNTAAIAPNLSTGQLDIGHMAAAPGFFNAVARGLPIKAILDASHYPANGRSHVIMARQELYDNGQLRSVDQLRGRRIAMSSVPGGLGIDVDRSLGRVGLSLDAVDQVQIPFVEQAVALSNGAVDAAATLEPFASLMAERGIAQTIRYLNDDYPGHQVSFPMIGPRLGGQPEVVRAFAVAYLRAARDYERARQYGEGVDEVAAAISKHNNQPAATIAGVFRAGGMTAMDPDGRLNTESIEYDMHWYRERGFIDRELAIVDFVDPQYAEHAVSVLGPWR